MKLLFLRDIKMNKLFAAIFSSVIVVTQQYSNKYFIEKLINYYVFSFIQIVQRTIHAGDMDIAEILLKVISFVTVNFGGMVHIVMNKRIVAYK